MHQWRVNFNSGSSEFHILAHCKSSVKFPMFFAHQQYTVTGLMCLIGLRRGERLMHMEHEQLSLQNRI